MGRGKKTAFSGQQLVQFGYRPSELLHIPQVTFKPLGEPADSLKIKRRKTFYDPTVRHASAVSGGCHVEGAVLPRPDTVDPDTFARAVVKRFGHKPPAIKTGVFQELLDFTEEYVRKHFTPIPPEADLSFESWIESVNQPGWRKDELREAHSRVDEMMAEKAGIQRVRRVGSFGKEEAYETWKEVRWINARSDEFKVLVGPAFHAIEKVVFADPSFIKTVPRSEWPAFIQQELKWKHFIYISDFSSFEALFEELMEVELILYRWMLQYHPLELRRVEMIDDENVCETKHLIARVWRKRMSGEMNTSLGNGFTTHVTGKFLGVKHHGREVIILQEGDDTIYCAPGPMEESWYRDIGLDVKLERVTDVSHGQFCQLLFDEDDMRVVRDVRKYIVGFAWLPSKYIPGVRVYPHLIRARAMSCIAQYPGHPILVSFARWILRCVQVSDVAVRRVIERTRAIDSYTREVLLNSIDVYQSKFDVPIGIRTRHYYEEHFGFSVADQLIMEAYFDEQEVLHPIPLSLFDGHQLPLEWLDCWDWYVRETDITSNGWKQADVGP